jgi:hypothetical protein
VVDATVWIMLINALAIGMFVLALIGAVRPLTSMTWRSAIDRRIDKHVGRARDLTCPVQRDFHEQKAMQEEWWLQSLNRFQNHRSVSLAWCLIVAAAAGMLVVTFPVVAVSTDAKLALPFIFCSSSQVSTTFTRYIACLCAASINSFSRRFGDETSRLSCALRRFQPGLFRFEEAPVLSQGSRCWHGQLRCNKSEGGSGCRISRTAMTHTSTRIGLTTSQYAKHSSFSMTRVL